MSRSFVTIENASLPVRIVRFICVVILAGVLASGAGVLLAGLVEQHFTYSHMVTAGLIGSFISAALALFFGRCVRSWDTEEIITGDVTQITGEVSRITGDVTRLK